MALNFSSSPYFDDFDPSKNYHRVLFKPGYSVQARELTQTQSILQNQISNFADNIFSQNTPVKGGKVTTNLQCNYIKLNTQYNGVPVIAGNFLNTLITDSTGQILARVVATAEATGTSTSAGDPPTLVVTYISGIQFSDGMQIFPTNGSNYSATTIGSVGGTTCTGLSSVASISDGIFYVVNGYSISSTKNPDGTYTKYSIGNFVSVLAQTIILNKYSNTPSYRVGLNINETITDYITDTTLLDPALGASNYQAPGADRYQITLQLITLPLTLGNDDGFIELLRINNGQIIKQVDGTVYSAIDDYFAKRDYETNGDYIVNNFTFTPSSNALGNTSKYDLSISKGIAYVHGYRIENQSPLTLTSDRARTTSTIPVNDIYIDYGNYYYVDTANGFFDTTTSPSVDLHCIPYSNIVSANTSTYSSTLIGSAFIRGLQYVSDSGSANTSTYVYKAYVSDIQTTTLSGNVASATSTTITISDAAHKFSTYSNAYINMTVSITAGTDAGDTRVISQYNGSTKTITVTQPFTFTPDTTTQFTLLFSTVDVESIVEKNSSYVVTSGCNINTASGKQNSISTGYSILESTGYPELVFRVGNPYVASLSNTSYVSTKNWRNNHQFSAGGSLTLNITSGPLRFIGSGVLSNDVIKQNYFMVNSVTGKVLDLTSTSSCSVSVTSNQQQVTFNCSSYANYYVDIITVVNVTSADSSAGGILKAKNLITGNTALVSSSFSSVTGTTSVDLSYGQTYITNAGTGSGHISLYASDIKKVTKVIDTLSPSTAITTAMLTDSQYDVTNQYKFGTGQKDNYYDHGYVSLIPGANPAKGNLLVIFDRYSHSGGDGYFSVLSYLSPTAGGVSTSPESYQKIPSYTATNGTTYRLSDCLDFRPSRASGTSTFAFEYYTTTTSDGGILIPQNLTQFQNTYSYYLGRNDILVLSKDKSFQIIEGAPSISPIPPTAPNGALILSNLSHDPYTAYVPGENPAGTPANLSINTVPHNRWAKSDITNLQTRVNNLEYYTSLSVLEQNTQALQVPDVNGLNRFKNGILVDDFSSFGTADTLNPDYAANINIRTQQLTPITLVDNFQLQNPFVVSSLGTLANTNTFAISSINGTHSNIYTLPYKTTNAIVQPLATSSVSLNPFAVTIYQGVAQLFPPMDNWVDNTQAPALLITDPNMQVNQQTNGVNLTNAGDFATIPGTEVSVTSSTSVSNHGNPAVNSPFGSSVGYTATTTSTYASQLQNISTTVNTSTLNSSLNINNGYLTNIAVLPYIRPQQIGFSIKGLLANAPISTWFDGVNVDQYITTPNTIELKSTSGTFKISDIVGFYTNNKFYPVGRVEGIYNYPNSKNVRLYVSAVLGAPAYTTTNIVQNAFFDSNGHYTGTTANGTVNGATKALHTSGQITGVGGSYTPVSGGSASQIYKVQDPNDWCSFLNQYGVWGDLNQSASYSASFIFAPVVSGLHTVILSNTGSATVKINGTSVVSGSSYTSTETGTFAGTAGTNVTLSWTVTGSSGPAGIAVTVTDSSGNVVFTSNIPPNLTYDNVTQEIVMPNGGAWFTGVTTLKLDQIAQQSSATYYVGSKINITSTFVYNYTSQTATYVPPPPAPSGGGGGGGKIICKKLAELGYFDKEMNDADQRFGVQLRDSDPNAYYGYLRWAQTVVDLMNGKGSSVLRKIVFPWIRDEQARIEKQKKIVIYYMDMLARPWAEEMAFRMNAKGYTKSNFSGKLIMDIGLPLCRKIGKIQSNKNLPLIVKILIIWGTVSILAISVLAISGVNKVINKITSWFKKQPEIQSKYSQ